MQTGVARTYIGSASQVKDEVLTAAKLAFLRKYARAYLSADQTLAAATLTKIQFNAKSYDPAALFDATTNYRFTVPAGYAGKWLIHACVGLYSAGSNTTGSLQIFVNGSARGYVYFYQPAATLLSPQITDILNLAAGDYVEIYIYVSVAGTAYGYEDRTWADFAYLASDSAITPP
jgi:hypothetical protein